VIRRGACEILCRGAGVGVRARAKQRPQQSSKSESSNSNPALYSKNANIKSSTKRLPSIERKMIVHACSVGSSCFIWYSNFYAQGAARKDDPKESTFVQAAFPGKHKHLNGRGHFEQQGEPQQQANSG
jgi:hypothetical protein